MATSELPGELEQTKRRQASSAPPGIGLTPEQQKVKADAEWRRGAQQRQAEFRQGLGNAVGQAARSVAGAAMMPVDFIRNTTFDSNLPDYSTPTKEVAKQQAAQQRASDWVAQNPQAAEQASKGLQGVANRAVGVAQVPFTNGIAHGLLTNTLHSTAPRGPGSAGSAASGGAPGGWSSVVPAADQPAPATPAQSGGLASWSRTGIGAGRAGGEIVGRMGANGVSEFSNREVDVKGADPQRAVGRVGEGIGGGISLGQPGDAQAAIQSFERANAIRGEQLGGFHVGGIRSGAPTSAELLNARLGLRMREADRADRELQQQGIDAGLDRALKERELVGAEQRTQQEVEAGNLTLEQSRRLGNLQQQYLAADEAQRPAIAAQIRALSGKDESSMTPRDYIVKRKVPVLDAQGYPAGEREELVDGRTGQVIGGGPGVLSGNSSPARTSVSRAEVEQTARNRGMTTEQVIEQLKQRGVSVNG